MSEERKLQITEVNQRLAIIFSGIIVIGLVFWFFFIQLPILQDGWDKMDIAEFLVSRIQMHLPDNTKYSMFGKCDFQLVWKENLYPYLLTHFDEGCPEKTSKMIEDIYFEIMKTLPTRGNIET